MNIYDMIQNGNFGDNAPMGNIVPFGYNTYNQPVYYSPNSLYLLRYLSSQYIILMSIIIHILVHFLSLVSMGIHTVMVWVNL